MNVLEQVPIWLPGQGLVDVRASRVDRAVREYDERLRFGLNEANQQYAIFLRFGPNDLGYPELYPVLGFGFEIPEPHEAIHRLREADTLRHGDRMLHEMQRHNEALLEKTREPVRAAEDELVLGIESYMRNQGELRYSKSFSKEVESRRTR